MRLRLSLRARLIGLLLLGLAATSCMLLVLQADQRHSTELMVRDRERVARRTFEQILDMKAQALELHARDYSIWDDFVGFLATRDTTWAHVNLRQNGFTFPMDLSWALDTDLRPVYATRFVSGPPVPAPPVPVGTLRRRLATGWFQHFFTRTDEGVLEMWVAPVQPSADAQRVTRPRGFYVVGRFWGPHLISGLSAACDGQVSVIRSSGPTAGRSDDAIAVDRPLPDADGRPLAYARLEQPVPLAARLRRDAWRTTVLLGLAHLLMLLTAAHYLSRWITRPLESIRAALRSERVTDLGPLVGRPNEFGRIADLVASFFTQREELVTEVAERRRVQQEIVRQKDFVRQVIDTLPDPLLVVDEHDRVILLNETAMTRFAGGSERALGADVAKLLEPLGCAGVFASLRARCLRAHGPVAEEHDVIALQVGRRHYRTAACPVWLPNGEAQILMLSEDVTEQVRAREELRAAKDAAEAGVRAKSQFVANVSHELRTPLHGILSFARFGCDDWERQPRETLRDYFVSIDECATGLLALVNDLIDLTWLESGRSGFALRPVDLDELLESARAEFDPIARQKGVQLTLEPCARPPVVRADRTRIVQVLRNLLSNAIQFTPAGRGVQLGMEWNERYVRVRVRDEGIGIPPEELEMVFGKFVQSSRGDGAGGTGLGLPICREILEGHDGRIWAEVREGGGTVLTFELPVAVVATDDATDSDAEASAA